MRLENFDPSTIRAIEKMFQALSDDLGNGVSEERAGWRPLADFGIEPPDEGELLRRAVIESDSRGQFRLNFKNNRIRREFKTFDLQFELLDCFLRDTEKVSEAQRILKQITEMLQITPEYWAYIIALGWWKMLEISEMPARVDDILGEGFSPEDWMIRASRSSSQLALNVARKYGEVEDFDEVVNFLEKRRICNTQDIILSLTLNQDDIQKVMKVLKWEEIEAELTEPNIKVLAFFWSFLFALKCNNLYPVTTEFSLKLYDTIWNSLENLLREKESDILSNLENTIRTLTEEGIIWASDILYLPVII